MAAMVLRLQVCYFRLRSFFFTCVYFFWLVRWGGISFLCLVRMLSFCRFYCYSLFHSICIFSLFLISLSPNRFLLMWPGLCVCSGVGCVMDLSSSCPHHMICGNSGVWMMSSPVCSPSCVVWEFGHFCLCPVFHDSWICCCGRVYHSGGRDQILGGVGFFLVGLCSGVFLGFCVMVWSVFSGWFLVSLWCVF